MSSPPHKEPAKNRMQQPTPLRSAVFLDRDGTIIRDAHYLGDPERVQLLPGAAEAIARLNRAEIPVIVVTNQSGIGRGYFTEDEFRAVQGRMLRLLAERGARVDATYHCPHSPDGEPGCHCRKPMVGLFLRAAREHRVDAARSWFVGDRVRDVEPAQRLGGKGVLLRHGGEVAPAGVEVVGSLAEAVRLILAERGAD